MTAVLAPQPVFQAFSPNGQFLVGGQLFTYAAGTSTPQATYVDSTQTTQNPNPVILNAMGQAQVWLNPLLSYKFVLEDSAGNLLWTVDNADALPSISGNLIPSVTNTFNIGSPTFTWANGYFGTQLYVGTFPLYSTAGLGYWAVTPAETQAGAFPQNFFYPPGYVDRYATNTSPGVTDMSFAVQVAVNVAQAVIGAGQSGTPVRFMAAAYLINTPADITTSPPNIQIPLDIGGAGMGTVAYCGTSGTGGLFSITSGCHLHDMQIVSAAGTTNTGVIVETTNGTQPIGFLIERIYSRMSGIGFLLENCNSGVIRDCWHWMDNAPALPIAISAAGASVNHGIYATGGFVNDLTIFDFRGRASAGFASGQRWIKNDCTNSLNFRIRGGLPINDSPGTSQKFLELGNASGGSHIIAAEVTGVYHESGYLEFNDCTFSNIASCSNGGVADASGLGLNFQLNSIGNFIGANAETASTLAFDATSGGNVIAAGSYGTITDSVSGTTAPNLYQSPNRSASYGGVIAQAVAYSPTMSPNAAGGDFMTIQVTNNTGFTINLPSNLGLGATFYIQIEAVGATPGTGTFAAGFKMPSNTPTMPASGFGRTWQFLYDGTHAKLVVPPSADVPN